MTDGLIIHQAKARTGASSRGEMKSEVLPDAGVTTQSVVVPGQTGRRGLMGTPHNQDRVEAW